MLSDSQVKALKPKSKPYKVSDERGLYVYVSITGARNWRFDYRYEGKRKTLALGAYPDVPLAAAREKREEARKLIAAGGDPCSQKKASKQVQNQSGDTFELLAREWLEIYMRNKVSSHKDKVQRRFETYVFPWLGARIAREITPPELLQCIRRIELLNKLETAHRTLQASGQVFRYGVQTGRCDRDITADLRGALPQPTVKHMAALIQPHEVAELLRSFDAFTGSITVKTALLVAPHLFCRPGELRTMRWSEVDLDAGEWRYLVTKTKTEHLVPLSRQVIESLESLKPFSGHLEYVFMGGRDPNRPMSEAAINAALRRLGWSTKDEISGHGFRAMARTLLNEHLDMPAHIIEHQLAHAVPDSLGKAYNRTKFLAQRKEMMQVWSDYLSQLTTNHD